MPTQQVGVAPGDPYTSPGTGPHFKVLYLGIKVYHFKDILGGGQIFVFINKTFIWRYIKYVCTYIQKLLFVQDKAV